MRTFTASRISANDNTLYPDRVEIDDQNVTFYKGYVFGYRTTVIARWNIASVSVGAGIFFVDVIISSKGGERIVANGFTKRDAKEINRLLTQAYG